MADPATKGQSSSQRRKKHDDFVMATNSSSIVSKRSVERLYYPEPHVFRHFVKKPIRRSPLINRGYWLRMHAIEVVVSQFLKEHLDQQKIVLNLGCGYDPLPFQWLSREKSTVCQNVCFVDIDFPDLIERKCNIISATPQLNKLLDPFETPSKPEGVHLRSAHYVALGCDLGDTEKLDKMLRSEVDVARSLILCTAEVSITYMDLQAADALISWASSFENVRFCILEQYLPHGSEHPFARKMIQHFNNLQTPLKVIHTYPRLEDQEQRFSDAGWFSASARSLWGIWLDPAFLSREQRIAIDNVEPFDEWEEFVLFASHYFLLTANSKGSMQNLGHDTSRVLRRCRSDDEEASSAPILIRRDTYKSSKRRFGALVNLAPGIVGHHGGLGAQSRLDSMDLYAISNALPTLAGGVPSISPRMCHSITAFGESSLLVGGRTSPKHPLEDCWLFRRSRWTRVDDLPIPLFRHCAAEVVLEGDKVLRGILINGGKTSRNQISDRWLLWSEDHGWTRVTCRQCHFAARFGAAIVSTSGSRGILIGGMGADGTIFEELWEWKLEMTKNSPSIELKRCEHLMLHDAGAMLRSPANRSNAVGRMGACLVRSAANILLIGGVHSSVLAADHDIAALSQDAAESNYWQISPVKFRRSDDQCLFVGHSAALTTSGCIALVGGGAMCFSFGTHWNTSIITLSTRGTEAFSAKVDELPNSLSSSSSPDESREQSNDIQIEPPLNKVTRVERYHLKSPEDFKKMMNDRLPRIIHNMNIGACTSVWNLDNLKVKIGNDRMVIVHEAADSHMDFQDKNFKYTEKLFSRFVTEINEGSMQYLRSLSSDNPSGKPANFWADYPDLAADFELPPELNLIMENMHSSVLRVSGPVNMWLHYDVMANVLCQIHGTKRLILYPPSDISLFSIPAGASSASKPPRLAGHHPYEVLLRPGDVLFIPPLWLHTASPVDKVSISINVFFRDLDSGYAAGRDVYGNRDLQAYEKGRKELEKIAKSFERLPPEVGRFYMERLANELKDKAIRTKT